MPASNRVKTYADGEAVEASERNGIQDNYIENHQLMQTRVLKFGLAGNLRTSSALSYTATRIQSINSGDIFDVCLQGLWQETGAQIVDLRVRVNQASGDQWGLALWEEDSRGTQTPRAVHTPNATTGWKWIDLGSIAVEINDGSNYWITMFHNSAGSGTDLLEATMCQVKMGG